MINRRKFLLFGSASLAALALPIPKFATGGAITPPVRVAHMVIPEQWVATSEAMRLRAAYRRAYPVYEVFMRDTLNKVSDSLNIPYELLTVDFEKEETEWQTSM